MSYLDRESRDEEQKLHDLENETSAIEGRPHNGFSDAARVASLESEIEGLDEQIQREEQRAVGGEG